MKLLHRFSRLKTSRNDLITLIVLGILLWLTSSGMWDLRGPDEARYIQVAKELLSRNDWFYLTVHGKPYDQKPPLAFWLFAIMLKLSGGGINAWALRLPSILAAVGTVIFTYLMGRHSFGRRSGFIAALILMTSPLFIKSAPVAELDMLYTVALTGALCVWITRPPSDRNPMSLIRVITFWGCLAAAFFIKGPLALIIALAAVCWTAWRSRSWTGVQALRPLVGIVFLFGLIAGWIYLQRKIYGDGFVKSQITGETVSRLLHGDHGEPPWYYLPRILTSIMFPWALLAFPALALFIKRRGKHSIDSAARPYFGWLVLPFLLLCLAHGKRQTYLLPLLPAAAVLTGAYFARCFASMQIHRSTTRYWAIGIAGLGVIISGIGIVIATNPDMVRNDIMWLSTPGIALLILCGLIVIAIAWRLTKQSLPHRSSLLYATSAVILVIAWTNFMVIRPAFDPSKTTRYLSETIDLHLRNHHGEESPGTAIVGAIGDASEEEYHVYGRYNVKPLSEADALQLNQKTPAPDVVVLKAGENQSNRVAQSLLRSGYTNRRHVRVSKDDLVLFEKPKRQNHFPQKDGFNFHFVGDTGSGKPQIYNVVKEIAQLQKSNPVDGIFLLGDNLYKGHIVAQSLQEYFVKPFAPLLASNIPFYAVLGNHDYDNSRMRGEVEFPLFNMAGQRYYSLDYGTGQDSVSAFICDGQALLAGDSKQAVWLDFAVKRSRSDWKILLIHEPIEASEVHHGGSNKLQKILKNTLPDIDVVLSGHNHLYERRKLVNGTLHITTGSGGQLATDEFPPDNHRVIGYNKLGTFVNMNLKNGEATVTALNENGQIIDQCILMRDTSGANIVINTMTDPKDEMPDPQSGTDHGKLIATQVTRR